MVATSSALRPSRPSLNARPSSPTAAAAAPSPSRASLKPCPSPTADHRETRISRTNSVAGASRGSPTPTRATLPANLKQQALGSGATVVFSGRPFHVTEPLGKGSFGVVWGARASDGASVAIKEIPCKSEAELARVVAEGQLLKLVKQELFVAGGAQLVKRVPVLVASDVETTAPRSWRVRLVMSEVPGRPLEELLDSRRQAEKLRKSITVRERQQQFAEACRYAGELLVQLAPTLEAFSSKVYHRDVTPRNIQVAERGADGEPQFGLVDFGLAVDAEKWRSQEEGSGDLGGDGRYWPASAWFVFGHGTRELRRHPNMHQEYRACLDVHSLGLTALRCLVELMPNLDLLEDLPNDPWMNTAILRLRDLRSAWSRYWSDARRFWQPVFDAFRGNGDFETLRAAYIGAGVHRLVSADLLALRGSLEEARTACRGMPSETGLAGMSALFDALLLMLQAAREGEQVPSSALPVHNERPAERRQTAAPATPSASASRARTPMVSGCDLALPRWRSVSTGTPDSSPTSLSDASSEDEASPSRSRRHLFEAWGADVECKRSYGAGLPAASPTHDAAAPAHAYAWTPMRA